MDTLAGTLGQTGQRFTGLGQPAAEQAAVAREVEAEASGVRSPNCGRRSPS
jgi:hypothetical protein